MVPNSTNKPPLQHVDDPQAEKKVEGLEVLAHRLAAEQPASGRTSSGPYLLDRLEGQAELLRKAYRHFAGTSREELSYSYAAEWLLDNFYIIQQALRQVKEDMPPGYYRKLPGLDASSPLADYPRIYALAREIVRYSGLQLDMDRVQRFIMAYQQVTPLTMGELWALPTMLRLTIIENMVQAVVDLTRLSISHQLLSPQAALPELADEDIVANSIISLRKLSVQDWKTFFESLSLVEQALRQDPAGVYPHMDFETRDTYRKTVEELALAAGYAEEQVARETLHLAQQADRFGLRPEFADRSRHVGYYLLDKGRTLLENGLEYQPGLSARIRRWLFDHPSLVYLGSIGLLSLLLLLLLINYSLAAGATMWQMAATAALGLILAVTAAVTVINWLITRSIRPRVLPKMNFEEEIPVEFSTMVVIPALLTSESAVTGLLQQLELHFLRNSGPHLYFALLTDFADAPAQHMPEDEALVEAARAGIQALNEKYDRQEGCPPFFFFNRDRAWNPGESVWMGWERKRGKLAEFNHLLLGSRDTSYSVQEGHLELLPGIKYVITLDADTVLPRGAARTLAGTLAHPLNQAVFDPGTGAVVAGYTVLQPRTEVKPGIANVSLFTQIFSGDTGLDLYTLAVSDVYQDLFGEGIYVGKGIYDVAAFERSVAGRVPENSLLSHDLFEGIHGRAGLATDIVLFEDYPPNYLVQVHRSHRWVRGDWQLLPWLLPRVPAAGGRKLNDLSLIDRWKIVDNLRRSLVAPGLLVLLVAGWLWLPGSPPIWTLAGLLLSAAPLLTAMIGELAGLLTGNSSVGSALQSIRNAALRWLLELAFLPYETVVMLDAIGRTLWRVLVSRKRLLEWTTAADTVHLFGREMKPDLTWRKMISSLLFAAALAALITLVNPESLLPALPLLAAWLLAPEIAYWISRPISYEPAPLSVGQRQRLRSLGRSTWFYFEKFVDPEGHWLPPDHFQESPRGTVAYRTSPTNIGLYLLSALTAYDLGYIGLPGLALRLGDTFNEMDKLERYRGHFLNWYNTRTLEPLTPRYVSTVDSGNLAASFLALRQGCLSLPDHPVLRPERWQGLQDSLAVLTEILERISAVTDRRTRPVLDHLERIQQQILALPGDRTEWPGLWAQLGDQDWPEFERSLAAWVETAAAELEVMTLQSLQMWSERVRLQILYTRRELDLLAPWLTLLNRPPALFERTDLDPGLARLWQALQAALPANPPLNRVGEICRAGQGHLAGLKNRLSRQPGPRDHVEEAQVWSTNLSLKLQVARKAARGLLADYASLSSRADRYVQEMDFGFLFDKNRQVFHIGYNVDAGLLDGNYYDLFASEARIASFVAIAKNDIPQSHWLHLGRPLTQANGSRALLSWSGTMFEYLMPPLLMRSYEGTLLNQTAQAVTKLQIAYGKQHKVPWGISESGYYHFDSNQNYQYQAFGIPGLGFKRGLGENLVVTPYASLLALSVQPQAVLENIEHLEEAGMLGHYGLYEAIDYTQARLPIGRQQAIVRSYMAHHQGMILLALANYLLDEAMVHRFHADPRIQSIDLLLQEQIPQQAPLEELPSGDVTAVRPAHPPVTATPWSVPVQAPVPQAHYLSNGRYSLLITSAGSGFSRWQEVDLTRWRADTTLDNWGTWVYVQDRDSGELWSAGHQPVAVKPETQEVLYYPHKVEFRRRDQNISLAMEITIPPDEDIEIRQITLTNHSDHPRRLALTSYGEVILAAQAGDSRHPAFNKLFIESEYIADVNGLLFRRRPRSAKEDPLYLLHTMVVEEGELNLAYESDRLRFLGRGRTPRSPAALTEGRYSLSGTVGATLDPIMALGQEIELEPHATTRLAYLTIAAGSRQAAMALARRYRAWPIIDRAFDQARTQSELELRQLELSTPELERIQRLLSVLVYPAPDLRARPEILAGNSKGQPALWAYGISGDYPILLLQVSKQEDTALLRELLQAHAYWRRRQIKIDLVVINERQTGYAQELQDQMRRLLTRTNSGGWLNQRGGIFFVRADQLTEADRTLLKTAARAVLNSDNGSLAEQLAQIVQQPARLPALVPTRSITEEMEPTPSLSRPGHLVFDNGLGGFSPDGREYVIYLERGQWAPAPWSNIIANPEFGFLVTEAGGGYSWAANSGENRLTPWSNDPVTDKPGEALYLRDEETGQVWSPTPLPAGAPAPYLVRHGAGYSIFEHNSNGLKQRLRLFTVQDAPLKVIQLRLENTWNRTRRITATYFAEWVLGVNRDMAQQYVIPEYSANDYALLARNPYNVEFGERAAFLKTSKAPHGLTTDRTEFLGRLGSLGRPAALDRLGLSGHVAAGLDPCAAMQLHLDLAPGEADEIYFLIGQGADRAEANRLIEQYGDAEQVETAWQAATGFWENLLGAVTVQTPDVAMNFLLNRWLLYQDLSCRIWGRSGFYQSSGAFGFRDQLQDVMAVLHVRPETAREQILRAARHQFEAGDVLHWWHPPSGRGVRTRISDDLLWLPFVTAHYVSVTGDVSILRERQPFLAGLLLEPEEEERYGHYETTGEDYTLYEHCRRALQKGTTAGRHGLPLMGGGDWNDGMNRVGIEGRGESVWLGWFLYATLTRFAAICELMDEKPQAELYCQRALELQQALEANAWDGGWYRRAYYDDGAPLGSAQNRECQIDSIAQSWAVISGAGGPQRLEQALAAVYERLVRFDDRLVLLFTPPFDKTERDPGYIKGYLPGIRENGGQYTHAALWTVWATAQLGRGDQAGALFRLLNPIYHADTRDKVTRYKVEPYVVAADVYGVPPHTGRGGWTWYTGSGGWMYRLGLEAILGLRRQADRLFIEPSIPSDWPGYELTYRYQSTVYHIRVKNPEGVQRGVKQVTLDGKVLDNKAIPLVDDRQPHQVQVLLG